MRGWVVISLLVFISIAAHAQKQKCNLDGKKEDVDFPNIEAISNLGYQMTVSYTLPKANQTDFYREFYDVLNRRGKVISVQAGVSSAYMYASETSESWQITGKSCDLYDIADTPKMFKDDQTNWLHIESEAARTVGPSAMFKIAFDVWNGTERSSKMAYMGKFGQPIRGIPAQYWKRCMDDGSFVYYYFSTDELKYSSLVPLRVFFGGARQGEMTELTDQIYDVENFVTTTPADVFDLPKGKGCRRKEDIDAPELPNLENESIKFIAEVVYSITDSDGNLDGVDDSFISKLVFALDQTSNHIAYHFTPWTSKSSDEDDSTLEYIIYDMKHHYAYQTDLGTGKCQIIREKSFDPFYFLPHDAGKISLTDPSILYPNSEFQFLSEGVNRGLKVNIFERIIEKFPLQLKDGKQSIIPKAIVTHSYLKDNEVERTADSVKNALMQVEFTFYGRKGEKIEVLTFNFYEFSTQIVGKRSLFNIKRCFKNNDDYVWVTIGFNVDETLLPKIKEDVPSIQSNILSQITLNSELNAVRIPFILVDFSDMVYVSAMILGKPPVLLDYTEPQPDMSIADAAEEDGIEDLEDCASNCLEREDNCWGFSICGGVCAYGSVLSAKPKAQKNCQLYRRFDNTTYIPSKEMMVDNLRTRVQSKQFKLMIIGDENAMVNLDASSIEVSDPGEDDRIFYRLGNRLNPRMRVLKTGAKLRGIGTEIKDMGKLRYDECQKECLDYKDCETASYCLSDQKCMITTKYGDDLKPEEMVDDNMCNLVTKKYADHFDRSPGIVLSITAEEVLTEKDVENCARACLRSTKFNCKSFDHCTDGSGSCKLHTVHYLTANTREKIQEKSTTCGHYFRKYSTEFKKNPERRTAGSSLPPLTNLTIEECAQNCVEFGKGVCFGFDFCQGSTLLATSCTLLDKAMSNYKTVENKMCTNFIRAETQAAPMPFSNGYAGGIGFLCFLIGGVVGALVIFGIAYLRVNRR